MSINKTVVNFFSKAFSLPIRNETANHVNFMLMSLMPNFSCLEVRYENVSKYYPPETKINLWTSLIRFSG